MDKEEIISLLEDAINCMREYWTAKDEPFQLGLCCLLYTRFNGHIVYGELITIMRDIAPKYGGVVGTGYFWEKDQFGFDMRLKVLEEIRKEIEKI